MEASGAPGFRLSVLNPGGRDPEQAFTASDNKVGHAPVNFHAYAACTGGTFYSDPRRAAEDPAPVLLLLRGNLRAAEHALQYLKKTGSTVAVSFKETGLHQIAAQLGDAGRLRRARRLMEMADGCLAATPEAAEIYRDIRQSEKSVAFIPTPYPLHDERWTFDRPFRERTGLFVGTREWHVPSRNHAAALFAARQISEATGSAVTVYNVDGRSGAALLEEVGFSPERLHVLKRGSSYAEYLRVVAGHRVVFQMDTSFVPGQVAGDALLCRLPCVGGNGAIDRLGHPTTCGAGRSASELAQIATRLLADETFHRQTVADSQRQAMERLSFPACAEQLQRFFSRLDRRSVSR